MQIDFGDAKKFEWEEESFDPKQNEKQVRPTGELSFFHDDSGPRESFVGTPLYVAPEMLTDCVAVPATDLWALGCIIFRMHTGEYPFTAKGNQGLF